MAEVSETAPAKAAEVSETAPAKLTVSLRVVGVRADGYHLIEAEMVSIDLVDQLTFADAVENKSTLDIELEPPATSGLPIDPGPANLVTRALDHVGRRAHVTLRKRIPAGAGLGGGSTDAAAVLRWAGHRSPDAIRASAALGADVPFCVLGGRALVRGIGEQVEAIPFLARTYTLLIPGFGVSTPAVYRVWDELGGPEGATGNDLEPAALSVEPRLAAHRDRLWEASGTRPTLAGSGSTWFVEGACPGEGFIVVRTLPAVTTPR